MLMLRLDITGLMFKILHKIYENSLYWITEIRNRIHDFDVILVRVSRETIKSVKLIFLLLWCTISKHDLGIQLQGWCCRTNRFSVLLQRRSFPFALICSWLQFSSDGNNLERSWDWKIVMISAVHRVPFNSHYCVEKHSWVSIQTWPSAKLETRADFRSCFQIVSCSFVACHLPKWLLLCFQAQPCLSVWFLCAKNERRFKSALISTTGYCQGVYLNPRQSQILWQEIEFN